MSRPIGVTIIAILQWIGGVLNVLGGFMVLPADPLLGLLAITLGLLTIGLGVGMWYLHSWAWLGTLIIQSLGMVLTMISVIGGSTSGAWSIIINIIIIVYLMQDEVKSAFGR